MKKSVAYSTRPAALRGALSRSTMPAFSGAIGSSAPRATPRMQAYGPASPKALPSAKGSTALMPIPVMPMAATPSTRFAKFITSPVPLPFGVLRNPG
jgi:hypothetical protein